MMTYNMLRIIGQNTLMKTKSKRDKTKMILRKRLSTMIKEIMMIAAIYVKQPRKKIMKLGKGFTHIYIH